MLIPHIKENVNLDTNNDEYKFAVEELPYGRVNSFLNYFNKSIETDEVYYFSAKQSTNRNEVREYGTLISRNGIYISKQITSTTNEMNSKDIFLPFANLWKYNLENGVLKLTYIDLESKKEKFLKVSPTETSISLLNIKNILNFVISNQINHSLGKNCVLSEEEYLEKINQKEKKFKRSNKVKSASKTASVAGVAGSLGNYQNEYTDTKNFMNGSRENGYAAEYGNNVIDRLQGNTVINGKPEL